MQYDMSDYGSMFVPQGWQCPVCKRVYSPSQYYCLNCGGTYTTTITTDIKASSTWDLISDSITKTDVKILDEHLEAFKKLAE